MSRLAVIVTAYGQRGTENLPRIIEALRAQTLHPEEVWFVVENVTLKVPIDNPVSLWPKSRHAAWIDLPTPRNPDGTYAVVPYSLKQNYALDRTSCDYVAYLTDDSWPAPEKYARMVAALDENPEWGAVYCSQEFDEGQSRIANELVPDAHCRVDHTQVMHRLTADRWPEDMNDIMLGDAIFWRKLHASLGPFWPMGPEVLDYVRQTPSGISAGNRS